MKTCTQPGCTNAHRARGLCSGHWKQQYGKRPEVIAPCAVCATPTIKHAGGSRRPTCSNLCRYYLRWDRWPTSEVPSAHAARIAPINPDEILRPWHGKLYRIYIPDCRWCGKAFVTQQPAQVICSKACRKRSERARRKALEHNASGTYTWAEVIGLFLQFDRCCAYCRQPIEGQPAPDHVIPLSRGGSNSITNILPSCTLCNCDKRDLLLHDWALDRQRRNLPPVHTTWVRGDVRYQHLSIVQAHEHAA